MTNRSKNGEIMKIHNGMRPHDVIILLKIASLQNEPWLAKDLAFDLGISQSEVSESLNRSALAGLISKDKKFVMRKSLMEFIRFGLKYVYPEKPGAIVRGMPTAHSALPLKDLIAESEPYVWPDAEGVTSGQKIEPLHPKAPWACKKDPKLYELLSLIDAIRVGKAREQEIASIELEKRVLTYEE